MINPRNDLILYVTVGICVVGALLILLVMLPLTSGVSQKAAEVNLVAAQAAKASAEAETAHQEAETIRITREKEMSGWTAVTFKEAASGFSAYSCIAPVLVFAFIAFCLTLLGGKRGGE